MKTLPPFLGLYIAQAKWFMPTSGDNIPNGFCQTTKSRMCDAYEKRLMDLIENPEGGLEQEKIQSDDQT